MAKLDEQYTATPFYGVRRMTKYLTEDEGFEVGRDHVRTLLRRMGLTAIWSRDLTHAFFRVGERFDAAFHFFIVS